MPGPVMYRQQVLLEAHDIHLSNTPVGQPALPQRAQHVTPLARCCCCTPAGAQALVAWVLQRADPSTKLSMVAEEDSADLTAPSGAAMLTRITQLINSVLASEVEGAPQLTEQQVVELIGESHTQHLHELCADRPRLAALQWSSKSLLSQIKAGTHPDGSAWCLISCCGCVLVCCLAVAVAVTLQTWARVRVVHRGATGCWTLLTAHVALWVCGSMQCAWACCRTVKWCWACWAAPTCHSRLWLMTMVVQVRETAGCSWGALGVCADHEGLRCLGRASGGACLRASSAHVGSAAKVEAEESSALQLAGAVNTTHTHCCAVLLCRSCGAVVVRGSGLSVLGTPGRRCLRVPTAC
jgi:hypothetical protein